MKKRRLAPTAPAQGQRTAKLALPHTLKTKRAQRAKKATSYSNSCWGAVSQRFGGNWRLWPTTLPRKVRSHLHVERRLFTVRESRFQVPKLKVRVGFGFHHKMRTRRDQATLPCSVSRASQKQPFPNVSSENPFAKGKGN
ncbi:hypothetical protein TRVL_02434 [Trypanosoma vivax]|nr:hypothetical protein TRVL_02434 [Trypanosoma vivax]